MMVTPQNSNIPIGRFAPSPTGALHLGSLTTAVASYCHIKSLNGKWLVRIEDTDTQRCHPDHSAKILTDLTNLGLHWDGEVIYQSQRTDIYHHYIHDVLKPWCYGCQCSRKSLSDFQRQQTPKQTSTSVEPLLYPRLCLHQDLPFDKNKVRLQLPDKSIGFMDGIQGIQWQNPQRILGDVVIQRQNQMINYILACSIDDGLQGVTHVMRGLDILPMTTTQMTILSLSQLHQVTKWYHLPLLHNQYGQKLSKQNKAAPINTQNPTELLTHALMLLKQPKVEPDTPERMLKQAIAQWDNQPLKLAHSLGYC